MSAPDPETVKAFREFWEAAEAYLASLPDDHYKRSLWSIYVKAEIPTLCKHCNDWTSPEDDPYPTLCQACATAHAMLVALAEAAAELDDDEALPPMRGRNDE